MRIPSRLLSWFAKVAVVGLLIASGADAQPTYTLTELSLGGTWGTAVGLNDAGQVIGQAQTAGGETRAFLYDPTEGVQDLNDVVTDPEGFVMQSARSINAMGEILAEGYNPGQGTHQPVLLRVEQAP